MNYELSQGRCAFLNLMSGRRTGHILIGMFFCFLLCAPCRAQSVRVVEYYHTIHQRLYCTADYNPAACVRDLAVLQQILNVYHAESLGKWSWVIVSSPEWKALVMDTHLHAFSPAVTFLEDRETFFDASLFGADAGRAAELEQKFRVPWQQLLPLAITHELGHATCRDASEIRAELFASQLREGRSASCKALAGGIAASRIDANALLPQLVQAMQHHP